MAPLPASHSAPAAVAPPLALVVAPERPPAAPDCAVAAERELPPGTRPFRYWRGSWALPFTRVSKCTCGPVQLPVQPT